VIRLKLPELEDYNTLYPTRFKSEVVYWADDLSHPVPIEEYGPNRIFAQQTGVMLERIIMLDDRPIGTVTARDFISRTGQCTLGVVIADPKLWGHGYGTIAMRFFLELLYEKGFKLVVLETYANNKRAQRCFSRLGFVKHRVYFASGCGRFVLEMINRLSKNTELYSTTNLNRSSK